MINLSWKRKLLLAKGGQAVGAALIDCFATLGSQKVHESQPSFAQKSDLAELAQPAKRAASKQKTAPPVYRDEGLVSAPSLDRFCLGCALLPEHVLCDFLHHSVGLSHRKSVKLLKAYCVEGLLCRFFEQQEILYCVKDLLPRAWLQALANCNAAERLDVGSQLRRMVVFRMTRLLDKMLDCMRPTRKLLPGHGVLLGSSALGHGFALRDPHSRRVFKDFHSVILLVPSAVDLQTEQGCGIARQLCRLLFASRVLKTVNNSVFLTHPTFALMAHLLRSQASKKRTSRYALPGYWFASA